MIKALRKRTRPDNLVNQVRAGGKSTARRVYLVSVSGAVAFVAFQFFGPMLFLDADGMALRDTRVVAADFVGHVEKVHVKPGDIVAAGAVIATLQSGDMSDKLSDMIGRIATVSARRSQIEGRLRSLATLHPSAVERLSRARASRDKINDLARRQLTTSLRVSELAREVFDAEKEEAQITGEANALADELIGVRRNLEEMQKLLTLARASYNDGRIVTPIAGTIGARVVVPGVVISRGQSIAEVYYGDAHVKAFMPSSRLYGIEPGDQVVVTDGNIRRMGRIERVEGVSDQLPQEFQSSLKSVERQQLMRVNLNDVDAPFPVPSKVRVLGRFSPNSVFSLARNVLAVADGPRAAVSMMVAGLRGDTVSSDADLSAVGSVPKPRVPHSAFTLPPDDGPPDWRALSDRAPVKHWKARD
jgi:multidrug resistance efflux pump